MPELLISFIEVNPFVKTGSSDSELAKKGSEWLRWAVNQVFNRNKAYLKHHKVLTDLFHNHNEETSLSIVRYPLIQFHHRDKRFYITGINEGVAALDALLECCQRPVQLTDDIMISFTRLSASSVEIVKVPSPLSYRIINYLPFNSDKYREFTETRLLTGKIHLLRQQLSTHILKDFFKYLNVGIEEFALEIAKVDSFERPCMQLSVNRRKRDYRPFDLEFEADLLLPANICLGIGKAYGFGMLEPAL